MGRSPEELARIDNCNRLLTPISLSIAPSVPRIPDQDGELPGNQTVRYFGGAHRNFMSTVGVAAHLGECYSFAGFDQIGNLDNNALSRLAADPGLDLRLPFEPARQARRIVWIDHAQFCIVSVGGDLQVEVGSQ